MRDLPQGCTSSAWIENGRTWAAPDPSRQPAGFPRPDLVLSADVPGSDQVVRRAWLVLPGDVAGDLPVLMCPHPFGFSAVGNLFGEPAGLRTLVDVPGVTPAARRHGFATLTVEAEGARVSGASLGWGPNLDVYFTALATAVRAGVPLDLDRVAASGLSMGGQEAILLGCRYPGRVKAVAVQNAVTDVASWHAHLSGSSFGADHAAAIVQELAPGGVVSPEAWAERSPVSQLDAARGMKLQVRLNYLDSIVPATQQGAAYADALRRAGTPVEVIEDLPTLIDGRDPGRSAHEHVNWDAMLEWLKASLA